MRNIELKARLADLQAARNVARAIATKRLGVQQQVDTYFHCRHGRLKLRQIDGLSAQLVWYVRPDQQGPKASQYQLVPISNPETLKAALAAALGVRVVVQKRREIFLVDNVRIHLDEVAGLGDFLEFEAVLGPETDAILGPETDAILGPETDAILGPETADAAGRAQLDRLIETFALDPGDLLSGSYGDMLG